MDEALVSNWNSVVKPDDRVYHLGDVVMNRRALSIVGRLNGRKILIKGNHDTLRIDEYTPFFDDIRAYHILDNMLLCHVPVHPYSKNRFKANVHGHTHADIIPDPWYIPVSVEQINYTPISLEEVRKCVS
jgi:calcineurin-like phosphoesterase family protein